MARTVASPLGQAQPHPSSRLVSPPETPVRLTSSGGLLHMKRCSLILGCLLLGGILGTYVAAPLLQGQAPREGALVPKELTSYRDVVKQVLPAVVSIESRAKVIRAGRAPAPGINPAPFDDDRVPEEFRHFRRFLEHPQEEADDD